MYTELVEKGVITLDRLIDLMYTEPRKRFGMSTCSIEEELHKEKPTFAIWDLDETYKVCLLYTSKYEGKDYLYADPQVQAILQAAPYYKELGKDFGDTTLRYTDSYNYSEGDSETNSFSAGITAGGGTDYFDVSFRAGYTGMTRHFTETSFRTEHSTEFDATNYDSVILYRTPMTIYSYSVWDTEKEKWIENGIGSIYAGKPEYVQMLSLIHIFIFSMAAFFSKCEMYKKGV